MLVRCRFLGQAGWPAERSGSGRPAWHDDRYGSRRPVCQAAVCAYCVFMASPGCSDSRGFLEGVEDLAVQELVAQPGIEALDITVLPSQHEKVISRLLESARCARMYLRAIACTAIEPYETRPAADSLMATAGGGSGPVHTPAGLSPRRMPPQPPRRRPCGRPAH